MLENLKWKNEIAELQKYISYYEDISTELTSGIFTEFQHTIYPSHCKMDRTPTILYLLFTNISAWAVARRAIGTL